MSERYAIGDLTELHDGEMRCFEHVGEHGVVVCRVGGALHAFADNCSHRDAKLSEGRFRNGLITCPVHGAQFDVVTGLHQGPPASVPIKTYRLDQTESGEIVIDLK
jgi:3-phenylpropionate/trans-cinnamate dioxygenase ferredoxin component